MMPKRKRKKQKSIETLASWGRQRDAGKEHSGSQSGGLQSRNDSKELERWQGIQQQPVAAGRAVCACGMAGEAEWVAAAAAAAAGGGEKARHP